MKLIVIRHGETALNKDGKLRAWKDIPLDEHGQNQAKETGKELKEKNKLISQIFSSDLQRTVKTAEIVAKYVGNPPVEKTNVLRPWDMGILTGKDVMETLPILKDYIINKPEIKIPDGESFDTFKERFLRGVIDILKHNSNKFICLVTHHRGERVLNAWIKAGCKKNLEIDNNTMLQKGEEPGSWQEVEVTI